MIGTHEYFALGILISEIHAIELWAIVISDTSRIKMPIFQKV